MPSVGPGCVTYTHCALLWKANAVRRQKIKGRVFCTIAAFLGVIIPVIKTNVNIMTFIATKWLYG
jgi:hypothetical protein